MLKVCSYFYCLFCLNAILFQYELGFIAAVCGNLRVAGGDLIYQGTRWAGEQPWGEQPANAVCRRAWSLCCFKQKLELYSFSIGKRAFLLYWKMPYETKASVFCLCLKEQCVPYGGAAAGNQRPSFASPRCSLAHKAWQLVLPKERRWVPGKFLGTWASLTQIIHRSALLADGRCYSQVDADKGE